MLTGNMSTSGIWH